MTPTWPLEDVDATATALRETEEEVGLTRDFTKIDGLHNLSLLMMDEQAEV